MVSVMKGVKEDWGERKEGSVSQTRLPPSLSLRPEGLRGRNEKKDAHHRSAQSKESLEESVESGDGILDSLGSLHPPSVESNVRVGEFLDELNESRNDGVESVT